jgi:hypothetical protein
MGKTAIENGRPIAFIWEATKPDIVNLDCDNEEQGL